MSRRLNQKLGFMLLWPGLFLYFLGSKRTRVILVYKDQVLLIQDRSRYFFDDASWTFPGGGIHLGEKVTTAAAREVKEELGITIDPARLELLAVQRSGGYGLQYQAHFLVYTCTSQPNLSPDLKEVRTTRWYKLSETSHLLLKREAEHGLQLLAGNQ